MLNKFILSIGLLSLFTLISFAEEEKRKGPKLLELQGTQHRGKVTIDLNKVDLLVKNHYTVPRGKTLEIIGAGKIKFAIIGKEKSPAVAGHPIYGGARPAGEYNVYARLHIHGKLIIGKKKKLEETDHSQLPSINIGWTRFYAGCQFEIYNLVYTPDYRTSRVNGHLKVYNALLGNRVAWNGSGGLVLHSKYRSIFYHTIFDTTLITTGEPGSIQKNMKFVNCVFYDNYRISIQALWAMEKCDIHGRPFVIKNYKWARPPKLRGYNFFHDHDFPEYLNHAFREDLGKGYLVAKAQFPFNEFEHTR